MTKWQNNEKLTKSTKSAWQKWQNLWILCVLCHKNHKNDKIIHKICGFYDDWNCPMRHPHLGPKWQKWQNMSFLCFLYKNHKNHKITESLNIDSVKILMGGDTSGRYTTIIARWQPIAHSAHLSSTRSRRRVARLVGGQAHVFKRNWIVPSQNERFAARRSRASNFTSLLKQILGMVWRGGIVKHSQNLRNS